jgi:hypothetical protein
MIRIDNWGDAHGKWQQKNRTPTTGYGATFETNLI